MSKVVVIGSANVDLTVKVDRLPQEGETVSEGEFYRSFGGKGANQALAAHKAGADVRFIAKLGEDSDGDGILRHLKSQGIGTEGIVRDRTHQTGVALIVVDREGHNAIAVAPGSNRHLMPEDLQRVESLIAWGRVLLVQLEIPLETVGEALGLAKAHGLTTILNPAPLRPLPAAFFSQVDILTPNEVEAGALTKVKIRGPGDSDAAARKLIEMGCGQVIITLGERGACSLKGNMARHFPAVSVNAVDSTAAGDAFNGTLACAMDEGMPADQAIQFASVAGALAVTRRGAQDSLPGRQEIDELYARSFT